MKTKLHALALLASLTLGGAAAATPALADEEVVTTDVSYEIYDFYNPTELLGDGGIRVSARNEATGETFTADERSGNLFTLPVGTYTFSGRSQWCYLAPATLDIAADTTTIALYAGCE